MGQYGKLYDIVENSDNNHFVLTPSIVNAVVSVQDSNDISRYILPHINCYKNRSMISLKSVFTI